MRLKKEIAFFMIIFLLSTAGCAVDNDSEANTDSYSTNVTNDIDIREEDNIFQGDNDNSSSIDSNGDSEDIKDTSFKKMQLDISAWIDSDEEWIYEKSANIEIYNNAEIEFVRWVDEDKTCLQIGIAYKEKPKAHYYKHKEDYFIFKGEIETLQVRYAYWYLEGMDRWVFANPTFESHFEDINFDGVDELIIQRGINGNSEMIMFSAYEYKDGEYVFFPAFEWIYSYTVNTDNNTIECVRYSGDAEHIKYVTVYQYVDGKYIISDEYVE